MLNPNSTPLAHPFLECHPLDTGPSEQGCKKSLYLGNRTLILPHHWLRFSQGMLKHIYNITALLLFLHLQHTPFGSIDDHWPFIPKRNGHPTLRSHGRKGVVLRGEIEIGPMSLGLETCCHLFCLLFFSVFGRYQSILSEIRDFTIWWYIILCVFFFCNYLCLLNL